MASLPLHSSSRRDTWHRRISVLAAVVSVAVHAALLLTPRLRAPTPDAPTEAPPPTPFLRTVLLEGEAAPILPASSPFALGFLMDTGTCEPGRGPWRSFRRYYLNGAAYGGLIGTADAFACYVQALLDPRSGLLSEESRRLLFTENVLSSGKPSGMSLSWFKGELDGHTYFAHAGGGGGYYAEVRIYPELQRGSVILFNRSGMSDERFLDRVDRHLIHGPGTAEPTDR